MWVWDVGRNEGGSVDKGYGWELERGSGGMTCVGLERETGASNVVESRFIVPERIRKYSLQLYL